jgi:hypothetical protein
MFGFSDLAALCGPNHVPVIATDEETVARTSEAHSKIFFTFAPPFQEVTEYCIPAQATSQPLFARVPGRRILGTSHQTSGGGIMIVVEKDAPLQLKREEGAAA